MSEEKGGYYPRKKTVGQKGEMLDCKVSKFVPILAEQIRQLKKWGMQDHHPHHYLTIMTEEVGEVAEAILKTEGEGNTMTWDDVIKELVEVQAVAQSMKESIERNQK